MIEAVRTSTPSSVSTRRAFLTRDLKAVAICATAAIPTIVQMMTPTSAFARDRDDGGRDHDGRDHDGDHGGRPHGGGDGDDRGGGHGHGGGGRCFLRGTRILTATGECNIEDLVIGDRLPTVFGGTRPLQRIDRFRRFRSDARKPWSRDARPVRIARSALAPNIPHRDLYVTQGHALLFDDLLIPAGCLVNDTTISLDPASDRDELEFLHLKLETHDVIYAEGAPCETLLRFDETISSSDAALADQTPNTPSLHCAPIICNGPRSELRIRVRSLMSPWLGPQRFDDIRGRLELQAASTIPG
jgi:hypothetical protein